MNDRCSAALAAAATALIACPAMAAEIPKGIQHTNRLGIKLVRIEPGEFVMGCRSRTHGLPNLEAGGAVIRELKVHDGTGLRPAAAKESP